jgi:hypothetical protein
MRVKLARKFFIPIIIVALLATVVPAVSAFESHLINVRCRVEDPHSVHKTIELASYDNVQYLIDEGLIPASVDPNQPDIDSDYPNEVPTFTCVVWKLKLTMGNSYGYPITDVVVTDHFGAELGGVPLDSVPVYVFIKEHSKGKSKVDKFETQYRITWYVTYRDGDVSEPDYVDNLGILEPDESAYIEMYVWTKLNPAGKQEYTSPGDYTLNSGPTAKWFDLEGHQFSSKGETIDIYAFE